MRLALMAAAMLWPCAVLAEGDYLGPLIDALSDADRSVGQIVGTLEAAGFSVEIVEKAGPEILTEAAADPYYYYLSAGVGSPQDANSRLPPFIMLTCSRNGIATLNALQTGVNGPLLQLWPMPDFPPGAVAQLWCQVELLPLDGVELPSVVAVDLALTARFETVTREDGTAPSSEGTGAGWVIYPPLSTAAEAGELQIGQTRIKGRNPAMATPGKPDWIIYDHFETRFMHSFVIVSYLPARGS